MNFKPILDLVGNTPLVELKKICPNSNVTLLAKSMNLQAIHGFGQISS